MSVPAAAEPSQNAKDSKAAGIYLYSRVAASLLILGVVVAAPWLYGKAGFAYVSAIVLLQETAVALGSLGLPDAVFYFLGRNPERGAAIVRQTSFLLSVIAIPVVTVVAIVGYQMSGPELDLLPAIPWLVLALLIELPTQPAVNQLLAAGHAVIASVLFVGFMVLRTGVLMLPALVPALELSDVPWMLAITGMTRLLAHLYVVGRYYPKVRGASWVHKAEMRAILMFALPAGIAAMCGKLNHQVDKYVVQFILGVDAFAAYNVGAAELPLINIIPYAIGAVMQVRYVRLYAANDLAGLRALWYQSVEKTALAVVPLAIMFIVAARDLIPAVFGDAFLDAVLPFQLFTLILLHRVAAYGPMLQATNQTRVLLSSSLILILANVVLSVPFTYALGSHGAALATLCANIPAWGFTLWCIGGAMGGGIRTALPWRFYGQVVLLGATVGAVAWAVRHVSGAGHASGLGLTIAVYLVLYTALGRVTGILKREDLAFFRRWISFGVVK